MASVNYQYELIKMYLAAFIRPPEKSGLEYWLQQLGTGKSFDAVLETVFSLDIVTDTYPANLPHQSFVTLIYVNVFGKSPDLEGLNYWTQQMMNGRSRGNLVLDMINAGLNTQDGTDGKAYIINRLAVSQFAVDQQIYQKADISPSYLKDVMQSVNAEAGTVAVANKLLGSNVTGIGLGAPINALSVLAAADGLSVVEVNAGVTVQVDLTGTNAAVNNIVELLLDNKSFSSPITRQLNDTEIRAKKVSLVIPKTANWGNEGSKLLTVIVKDNAGNTSPPGGDLRVELNIIAPKAPTYNLAVPAASDSINLAEKISGVAVSVILLGTDAVAGDKVEILLNGQSFTQKILTTITSTDVQIGMVTTMIPGSVNWGLDGDKLLAARIIDIAGNVGGIGGTVVVNLDTTAPLSPINAVQIPAAANGLNYLERSSPVQVRVDLNGTNAKLGDSVELLVDDKVFASSTKQELTSADILSRFVMLSIAPLDLSWNIVEGNRNVSARLIDSAGNTGRSGGNFLVLVDSNAPRSETTSFSIAASLDGISAAEVATGVGVLVNLIGSGVVVGDTITILNGTDPAEVLFSQVITAAQVNAKQALLTVPATSNWGEDGSKVLAVSFVDIAGNISSASPSTIVLLDTRAPLASTADLQVPASLKGINTVEKAAGVTVNVSLAGTQAVAKDRLEILLAGNSFATPVMYSLSATDIENNQVSILVPGNAAWGADGIKKLSARVIDVAGNIGASSTSFDLLIDTLAPLGPLTAMSVPANADGGISILEKNAGVEVKLSLVGTNVQIGDSVELLIGGLGFSNPVTRILTDADLVSKSVSLTVGANDGWGTDGSKSLSARFTDFAGNVGLPSGTVKVILDGTPPNPTNGVLTVAAAQNGINAAEKNSVIDVIVNLNGTGAVSGDIINLYLDGQPFSTPIKLIVTAAQIIAKSATMKIPATALWGADGAHVLSVLISDAAGNLGQAGGDLVVNLDTTPPRAGSVPLQIPAAKDGISGLEKSLPMAILVSLLDTDAVAFDKVEILNNGLSFKNPIIQTLDSDDVDNGTLTISVPGGIDWGVDGAKNISFRLIDVAGNVGAISSPLVVNFDTQAPIGPSKPLIVPANLGGGISLAEKNAGVDVIVNLTGAAVVAGDTVELLIGGSPFATPVKHVITAAELSAKSLSMTISANDGWGADGPKNLTARFIDIAGNIGNGAGLAAVTLDTNVLNPTATPLILLAAANGINALEKNAGVDVTVNLDGTGAASGDQIQLLIDGIPFPTPIFHTITAAQVLAKSATFKVPGDANWGVDGQHVMTVSLIDKSGNVGSPGGDLSIILDTTIPATLTTPIEIAVAANGVNNAEKSAGVVVSINLAGTGAGEGERIELLLDGKAFSPNASLVLSSADIANGTANLIVGPTANWGLDGNKNVSARLIDVAGNIGLSGGNLVMVLDTSAPAGPTSPLSVPASVGGINAAELNAGINVIANLTGTKALAGDTIEILLGGNSFAKPVTHIVTAAELAAKAVTLTIGVGDGWGVDGLKGLTARFVDVAGNFGAASGLLNIAIDSVAPNPVSQQLQVAAANNAISNAERSAGVSVVVDLTGTGALAGDVISILIDGVPFTTPVTAKITGPQITAKSATVLIPGAAIWGSDGNKNLSAQITDAVGNVSIAGGNVDVILDTTAPVAPSNPVAIVAAVNGISAAEKLAGVNVRVDLTGSGAMVGDRLELLVGGLAFTVPIVYSLTALDLASGIVNLTISSGSGWGADGTKLISTRLTDVAGNIGNGSVSASVMLDTSAPLGPGSTLVISANSGGGITVAERNAGVDVLVNLSGTTVVAGDVVEILLGGASFSNPVIHTLTAADVAAKNVTLTIGGTDGWGADGTKVLTARFIDIAGNVGNATGTSNVILDGGAPNPPATPLVLSAAVNGISSAEKAAGVAVVVNLTGTGAVAGDVIRIQLNTVDFSTPVSHTITAAQATARSATVVIPGTANWGADGSKILTANITDVLGNIGTAGGDVTVNLDTTGPLSPANPLTIASASNGISMAEKSAGVSVSVDLTGIGLIAGESVELLINDFPFATPLIKALTALDISSGVAAITIPSGASWGVDGTKVISVRGIDIAGNLGLVGADLSILLDTTAPIGPSSVLSVVANDNGGITATEKNTGVAVDVNLAGANLVAGDKVELLIGGLPFATPIIRVLTPVEIGANLASLIIGATDGWGVDGSKTLTARFIDQAGNVGAGAGSVSVTMLDTTAPNVPSFPMLVSAAASGISVSEKNAGVSVLVNLAGTNAAAGDVASLFLDGAVFAVPVTHTITTGELSAGNFSFTVGGTDGWGADGNKVLSMNITDVAGNIGLTGGNVTVFLDSTLPNAPATAVVIVAAANGINLTEKTLGVNVVVDLTGTNAVVGDRVEILMGGVPLATPVFRTLSSADIIASSASVFIDSNAGWGVDGVKTISARIQDIAGNTGLPGGSLTTFLDTSVPSPAGLPVYIDVDGLGTINEGDTFLFTISEATNKAITINEILINNSHVFGTGATSEWSPDGTQLTVTLGADSTIAIGDIVTLVGVSDLAGNSLNLAFAI